MGKALSELGKAQPNFESAPGRGKGLLTDVCAASPCVAKEVRGCGVASDGSLRCRDQLALKRTVLRYAVLDEGTARQRHGIALPIGLAQTISSSVSKLLQYTRPRR